MPKLDEKKAELEDLKTWRNYAVTSLLGLIAFVFTKSGVIIMEILAISAGLFGICCFFTAFYMAVKG